MSITHRTGVDLLTLPQPKPHLDAKGYQVVVVSYADTHRQDLAFKLAGVNTLVSVVSGPAQLALIEAAAQAGIRRFAPAEFEGQAALRPQPDALDRGKHAALNRLRHYSQTRGMQYTSFVCGVLYERFSPGGMYARNIGLRSGIGAEGDYLVHISQKKAQIPYGTNGQPGIICMTSAEDVGKFVALALSLPQWPPELRMRGDRMNISQLVNIAETVRGMKDRHLCAKRANPQQVLLSRKYNTLPNTWHRPSSKHVHQARYRPSSERLP